MSLKKIIAIVGPTSSGKTGLSIKLTKKFNAEIISADSRQVYKGMDIGTGKITKKETRGVPHHLLDVVSFKKIFTVIDYKKLAEKSLKKIFKKGKVPFIVGGTGFYIRALIDKTAIPEVKPDWKLRRKLGEENTQSLFKRLEKIDPKRAKSIDEKNKRRIIRALEIVIKTKKPVPKIRKKKPEFEVLVLGIKKPKNELYRLIEKRLLKRLKKGMLKEAKKLREKGLSYKRMKELGLEYRYMAYYLQGQISYNEMVEKLKKEIEHYAKRQMTWFRKDSRVIWIKDYKEAENLIKRFLSNKKPRN
ncbi:MAG: tRNA (adenosine(37)-N6)-dimethylallyltransferase MiaA [Candidatus Pacebacteria bacterium]|nr:tRNA (adenosine(37)-N6)-dimethylallyltransferase MiaA [Candidatus Paceibacterota bacterium]